jgi:alkanesulfonate monooxygenase SsuD/methylene tetrahydromethanopterin reductase-like flavin-dependent oxidoreductase (luciferase family)
MPAVSALTFEEAVANMTNEDFSLREAGEDFLRALSLDDIPRLEALMLSPDPELAFRSRRALLFVRLRLDGPFPPDLAKKIALLPETNRRDTRATIDQLLGLQPLPILTLAGLHSEILANPHRYSRVGGESLKALGDALTTTASSKGEPLQIAEVRTLLYRNETLALLADGFARRQGANLEPIVGIYSSWVAKRPALLPMLTGAGIPLELVRIQAETQGANKQIPQMLTLARSFPSPSDQRKTILARMTQLLRANPSFPIDSLDRDQGYTLFAALEENWDPQMDVSSYHKFRQRFPDAHPNPESSTLEAIYLMEKEGVNTSLALALNQPNDRAAVWLGTYLQAHPEKIPNPLVIPPFKKDQRRHAHTSPFLNAMVPRDLNEMQSNPKAMAAFEAILRNDQWIDTALQANAGRLLYFQWIREGTLDAAIPKHLTGSTDRLRALGRLLVTKPDSMALINPAHQSPLDLQRILLGMLEQPLPTAVAEVLFTHADEWVKLYPDMWKNDAFRFEIPRIESIAANRTEALHQLLSLATKYPNAKPDPGHGASQNPALGMLLRSIKRYPEEALTFPTAKLAAEEAYLFFSVFGSTPEAKKNFAERYRAFRKRFTEQPPELESLPLEALIYLDAKQPNKAFALSMLQDSTVAAEWVGEWLNENPEALEKTLTLPNLGNRPRPHCDALLGALAPYRTLAECQAHPKQMAALKLLIDTPEWLDASLRGESARLVCLHILHTGDLDQMLARRLSGQPQAAVQLGGLLAENPQLLGSIKPENQTAASLQPLVLGLSQANATPQQRSEIDKAIQEWAKTIPEVLEKPAPIQKLQPERNPRFQMQLQIR